MRDQPVKDPDVNQGRLKLWIAALRSDRFKQVRRTLRVPDSPGRCCLGVLCDVALENGLADEKGIEGWSGAEFLWADGLQSEESILPEPVREWIGLPNPDPTLVTAEGHRFQATELNDDEGQSFEDIADVLERNYLVGASS